MLYGSAEPIFYILVAFMLSALIVGWQHGAADYYLAHSGNPLTLAVSGVLTAVFLIAWFWAGLVRTREISRSEEAMRIVLGMTDRNTLYGKRREAVRELFAYRFPARCRKPAVVRTLHALHERVGTVRALGGKKPVDKNALIDLFETNFDLGLEFFERVVILVLTLALLGTGLGIVYAFTQHTMAETAALTADESKLLILQNLQGMGIAYVSSIFGFGSASLLLVLGMFLGRRSEAVVRAFKDRMFSFVFPVIESGYGEESHETSS